LVTENKNQRLLLTRMPILSLWKIRNASISPEPQVIPALQMLNHQEEVVFERVMK
jgi:hypothetical protein